MISRPSDGWIGKATDSPWVVPIWISTHGLAAITGVLRVEAGQHFWTDVLVGSLVGSGIGMLVSYLHTRPTEKILSDKTGEISAQLMLSPMAYPEGLGLMLTWR